MISTLVSLCRRPIFETLPGFQHAFYSIDAAEGLNPQILHVNDSYYYKPDIDGNQDRVLVQSEQIASSLVHMHITSQLNFRVDRHPALFAIINRDVDADIVKKEFQKEIKEALKKQKAWFISLIESADDDWVQAPRHHMISDIQRTAARELGLSRPWLMTTPEDNEIPLEGCPFCGTNLLNPSAPICPTCGKVHNPVKLAEIEKSMKSMIPAVTKEVSRV